MTIRPWHLLYVALLTVLLMFTFVKWVWSQDADSKIGVATFRIWRQGDATMAVPLVAPSFRLTPLSGTGKEPETITKCVIIRRILDVNEQKQRAITVTVLKCGENTYGVSEVVFETEKP